MVRGCGVIPRGISTRRAPWTALRGLLFALSGIAASGLLVFSLLVFGLLASGTAAAAPPPSSAPQASRASPPATPDQRHPLEIRALTAPHEVLRALPAARAALAKGDHAGAARLALAQANACRVIADWHCQRMAGSIAMEHADRTNSVYLQVRARIALGRALSRLGDFANASKLITEARRRLGPNGDDALQADILLAYSSLSARLGKLDESYRYASEGLAHAPAATQPEMRIRLLRNMAQAASGTGRAREAQALLGEAEPLLVAMQDPKLSAEVLLEQANAAKALGDADAVEDRGRRIGAIGDELKNTQLRGLSFETIGHAQRMRGRHEAAYDAYAQARDAFAALHLYRDELRAVRQIVDLQLAGVRADRLPQSVARLTRLNDEVTRIERDSSAADFEERLRYAQSEAALATARAAEENAQLRTEVVENRFRYTLIAGVLALCTLAVAVALYAQQRRHATALRDRGRELEHAVATDFLTSVHSRRHLTEAGHAAVADARGGAERSLAVAVVDVDHFKRINDRFGHAVGDEVLKAVATAMRAVCRDSDLLGRYGGEEFAVLLRGIPPAHAFAAAERLREAVARVAVRAGDQTITPTASVGVACLRADDTHFDQVLIRADRALYRAKEAGRDRVVMAEADEAPAAPA
ncbi:MAG: diguanylate cyclase [Xanthomonadales bacterium]|nr:diguanylate cyclase [Xanthomonadales bacterium]